MKRKAIIISIKGYSLTSKEQLLISKEKPWGIILFQRNIRSLNQIKKLIKNIKKFAKNKNFPILIDEEGRAVSRLKKIISHNFDANFFGDFYKIDKSISISLYKNYLKYLCNQLKNIGINFNTIPVLDILRKNTNKVIGRRSFSNNKDIVKKLGDITINECHKNKIVSVIKHIPGHGCSSTDSHLRLPKVDLNLKKLNNIDFYPFKSTSAKLAMTAHILYKQIDLKTLQLFLKLSLKKLLEKIGFKGILMSDDISMKALKYDLKTNAKYSLKVGCNLFYNVLEILKTTLN